MSLFTRLMLLVLLTLAPMVGMEAYNQLSLRSAHEVEVHDQASRILGLIEAEQTRLIEGIRDLMVTLAEIPVIRAGHAGQCHGMMTRLAKRYPEYLSIQIADRAGVVGCATDPKSIGDRIGDWPHVGNALSTGNFIIGERILEHPDGPAVLPFALPFADLQGNPAGVITARLDLGWLKTYLAKHPLPANATLTIADRTGIMLARLPTDAERTGQRLPDGLLQLMREAQGRPRTMEFTAPDGGTRVLALSPPGDGLDSLIIGVALNKSQSMAAIDAAITRSILLTAVVLAITLLAAWQGGRAFIGKPLETVIETTRRWRAGELDLRLKLAAAPSEIGMLGTAFNIMADDLQNQVRVREEAHAMALRMAAVLESTTDAVLEIGRDWRIVYMNERATTQIAGNRDLVGMNLWDAFPQAVGSPFETHYRKVLDRREPAEFEAFYAPLDAWYAVRAFPSRDGVAVYLQDISQRKSLEAELEHNQRFLSLVLEALPVGVWMFDATGRIVGANPAARLIWGDIRPDDIDASSRGPGNGDMGSETGNAACTVRLTETGEPLAPSTWVSVRALRDGETTLGQMIDLDRSDGVRKTILASGAPLHDVQNHVVGAVVLTVDITEQRRAQQEERRLTDALDAERLRLKAVLDQMPLGVTIAEAATGRLVLHNEAAVRLLGHPLPGKGMGHDTDHGALHADGTLYRPEEYPLVRAARHGETIEQCEMAYRRGDGHITTLSVNAAPVRDTGGSRILAVSTFHDMAERKAMEEALRAAKEEAERANLAKSKFLAAASHDLRQPLQSLFLFAASLSGHVTDKDGREMLSHLERCLETLKGLLDSLLDISRLDAGVIEAHIEPFPIATLLDHINAGYGPIASAKGLAWQVAGSTLNVRSDPTLLGRMLRNLVENAIRYTETGSVSVACRQSGGMLLIQVRDTGIGIPPESLKDIFIEFHQVRDAGPREGQGLGLGLGLAIVERLARLLGHRVDVESHIGAGSVFTIAIPIAAAPTQPVAAGSAPHGSPQGDGCLAVVIDDDAIVLMGLRAILQEWRYAVISAGSADEAVKRVAADGRLPAIVIADYHLRGGETGTEAIRRVRALFAASIPGVILTGETDPDCLADAATEGLGVIHKPITPRQLGKLLASYQTAAE